MGEEEGDLSVQSSLRANIPEEVGRVGEDAAGDKKEEKPGSCLALPQTTSKK